MYRVNAHVFVCVCYTQYIQSVLFQSDANDDATLAKIRWKMAFVKNAGGKAGAFAAVILWIQWM